jgi:hypothetical protein
MQKVPYHSRGTLWGGIMNTNTGEIVEEKDIPFDKKGDYITIGDVVEIRGSRFRVTGMKPNGRLFLKLVRE